MDPAFDNSFGTMLYLLNLIKCMEGVEEDGLVWGTFTLKASGALQREVSNAFERFRS